MPKKPKCTFRFICDQTWEELHPTESETIKFCSHCAKDVHLCTNDDELTACADRKKCVCYDPTFYQRHKNGEKLTELEMSRDVYKTPEQTVGFITYESGDREEMSSEEKRKLRDAFKRTK